MPRLVSFRGLIQNFRSKQQKNNFKFRFLEVWRITVLATWLKNVILMTFSALSYLLQYKLPIFISTHNTRRSFRSENTSEGIWSISFHLRSLVGRKEAKDSVGFFFRFVVTEKEIYLLMCKRVLKKPYFLARTTGNMELVWKKNNGPQHSTIHASVALLAIYSTYRCIRCT